MTNMEHIIHRTVDIGSGFVIAIMIQYFIFPFFSLYPPIWDMIQISLIFTIVGITRSYLWSKYVFQYKR
jgi:putative flippase GtrA